MSRLSSPEHSRRGERRGRTGILLATLALATVAAVLWGPPALAELGGVVPMKPAPTPESISTRIAQAHPEVQYLQSLGFMKTSYEPWTMNDGVTVLGGIVTYSLPDSSPGVSVVGRTWPRFVYDETETTSPPYSLTDVTEDITGVTSVEVWVDINVGIVAGITDVPSFSIDEEGPDEPSDEPTCPPFS